MVKSGRMRKKMVKSAAGEKFLGQKAPQAKILSKSAIWLCQTNEKIFGKYSNIFLEKKNENIGKIFK